MCGALLAVAFQLAAISPALPQFDRGGTADAGIAPYGYVNLRDSHCGARGDGSTDDTVAIQTCIDYAHSNHLQGIFCPDGNYKITSSLYLDPPGNLRRNLTNPTIFAFSLAFVGVSAGLGNHEGFGCQIRPTFNNGVALWVGTGQGMKVSGVQILGPSGGYRG